MSDLDLWLPMIVVGAVAALMVGCLCVLWWQDWRYERQRRARRIHACDLNGDSIEQLVRQYQPKQRPGQANADLSGIPTFSDSGDAE